VIPRDKWPDAIPNAAVAAAIVTATVLWPFVWYYLGEAVPEDHSTTHTYPDHQLSFISLLYLLQSIASSLFNLGA